MGRLLFAESVSRYQGSIMRKIPHSSKFGRIFRKGKADSSSGDPAPGSFFPASHGKKGHLDTLSRFPLR
jgi:hypothetical protein